jgi:CheY-like chemotaxis protein
VDGYELMRRLRLSPGPSRGLPAIAVKANASKDDRERAVMAGFQMHLSKPVVPEQLLEMVSLLSRLRRG